jgi:hypothetical protein
VRDHVGCGADHRRSSARATLRCNSDQRDGGRDADIVRRLAEDIQLGRIAEVIRSFAHDGGDYMFTVAVK